MSVLRKYLFRQMRCNPLTVLLEILSLVIVTVVLYLNLNLAGDVRRSLEEETRKATGGYDICAEAADGKAFSLSGLDDLPKEALLPYTSRIYTLGDIPGVNYFVKISVDPTEVITRGMASLTDGRLPADETETLILITKSGNPSLAMGNVVTVYDDGGTPHSLTVCGVLSGFPLESNARPDLVELIVIPDASQTAQRVYIDSRLAGITQEELQTSHPELSVKPLLKEDDVREEIKGLSRVLLLVTGLVILLSGFILATLSGNRMEARRGDYSTFRSVGANRRQWTFLLYMENGVYALCGSVFGVPLGEICREMTVSRYYMATETKPPFLLRNALLAFAFTLCFEIAFTAVCSVRYASQSIRHSLFDKDTCAFRLKKSNLYTGLAFFFGSMIVYLCNRTCNAFVNEAVLLCALTGSILLIPWLVGSITCALHSLLLKGRGGTVSFVLTRISRSKTGVTSIRLLTASLALSSVFLFSVSSAEMFFDKYTHKYDYDLYVSNVGDNENVFDLIAEQPFTQSILLQYNKRTRVTLNGATHPDDVRFYKINGYTTGIELLNVSADALAPGHVIVDSLFAQTHRLRVGDTVQCCFETAGGSIRSFVILGLCDSSIHNTGRNTIILGDEDYFELFGKEPARVDITLAPGYTKEEVLTSLQYLSYLNISSDVEVGLNSKHLDVELSRTRAALKAFSVLPLLVTVMAVVGLINNQCLSFRRNRREIAVLYSVAMNKQQIYHTLILESVLQFAFGALFGAALSVYFMFIIRDILFVFICYIHIHVNVWQTLLVLAGAGVILVPVTLLPYATVLHMNIADEVKKDA